jgi:hypothetical protein
MTTESGRLKTDIEISRSTDYCWLCHLKGGSFRLAVISNTPTVLADLEPPFAFFKQPYPWIRVNNSRHIIDGERLHYFFKDHNSLSRGHNKSTGVQNVSRPALLIALRHD